MLNAPENPRPVRAKMYVREVVHSQWGVTVKLGVVTRGEDNRGWATSTPAGSLELSIDPTKTSAADQFAPNQEWFIDLVPIPADAQGKEGMTG